jgi:hypothetical protein
VEGGDPAKRKVGVNQGTRKSGKEEKIVFPGALLPGYANIRIQGYTDVRMRNSNAFG